MEYTSSPLQELKAFFSRRSALASLIWINAGVFLLVSLVNLFFWLFGIPNTSFDKDVSVIVSWLAVPADISMLIQKPWTLLSYMFLHEDFLHLLFNMMVLFFGGQLLTAFLDARKLVSTYLLSGLWGAIFFIVAFNTFPVFEGSVAVALALGASASVLGILVAAATYAPNYRVQLFLLGSVKLKHIALILIALDLISIHKENPGGHIAHLGGAFWGFCYIQGLKYFPRNQSKRSFGWLKAFFSVFKKQKTSFRVHQGQRGRPLKDEEYNAMKAGKQLEIDKILDKISKNGYESLSRTEKDLLFKSGTTKSQL